ncbi:hypothetical protein MLD38_006955 [Melastoma candidum]|uniref:Uncharacterized protein n=1 Tax=Melastoma candidum TaxID=119954 RepID=A0ACB9RQS6_9MYRT|nr:hypothetical protein MLD38_006955 [Melastoma candidum]
MLLSYMDGFIVWLVSDSQQTVNESFLSGRAGHDQLSCRSILYHGSDDRGKMEFILANAGKNQSNSSSQVDARTFFKAFESRFLHQPLRKHVMCAGIQVCKVLRGACNSLCCSTKKHYPHIMMKSCSEEDISDSCQQMKKLEKNAISIELRDAQKQRLWTAISPALQRLGTDQVDDRSFYPRERVLLQVWKEMAVDEKFCRPDELETKADDPPSDKNLSQNMRKEKATKEKMMHMTMYWSRYVTLLVDQWKTDTWTGYLLTLIACFLSASFYQYLENLRLRSLTSASDPVSVPLIVKLRRNRAARAASSALFGMSSAVGYLLMLAIMSFNGGVFLSIVAGLSVGYYVFRSIPDDAEVGKISAAAADNSCACA